jgi:hypothetical protein
VTVYNLMGDGLRDALDPKVVREPTREEPAALPQAATT